MAPRIEVEGVEPVHSIPRSSHPIRNGAHSKTIIFRAVDIVVSLS
jgi:hypothetical protein